MRTLAATIRSHFYRRNPVNLQYRNFSSFYKGVDEKSIEEEAERKVGWLLKLTFAGTATAVGYQLFPYMDEKSMEEEAERKVGWLLKLIFAGTATAVGYQLFPYMGDNLMQQSVSLLQVKDPLFKRMGASRLARFAIDDKRRMKIVEMGGAQELVNMLGSAKDDRTRKEALKALVAISKSDEAAGALHEAGAIPIIRSTPDSVEYTEIENYKLNLLTRFRDLRHDIPS